MQPLPHQYAARLTAAATGDAELTSDGVPPLALNAPVDFDGPGTAWSPEQLLLAAVEGCFLLTFRSVASLSKLPFVSLVAEARGTVDRNEGRVRFTAITVTAALTVPAGTDIERARRLAEKAEGACLISASLATPVHLEVRVNEAPAGA